MPRPLAIAWADWQPRTAALAGALGGEAVFVTGPLPRRPATAPLRYAWSAVRTWRDLERRRPSCVVVVAPPVVDCHTGTFHARRWATGG